MKKTLKILAMVLAFVITFAVAVACSGESCECEPIIPPDVDQSITIIAGSWRFENFTTDSETIGEVLDELNGWFDDEFNPFVFEYELGQFGRFINRIGSLDATDGGWIAFYLTHTNIRYSNPLQTRVVDDVTFRFANMGIDDMPVLAGTTYIFVMG
ncbi:MAG: hypothetical protein FWC80_06675 [Firmicutes bacterium]|nr:hypothetical protein [Bacillota bacterium]